MNIPGAFKHNLMLVQGWKTRRKIVVIESDDWGSIRTPDKTTLDKLAFINPKYKNDPFTLFDSIECNEDMDSLFEVLNGIKDSAGNNAVITANTIMANPDFEKISGSGFSKYYYEKFTDTLLRYPGRDKVHNLILQGIRRNIFKPQLHGREHVNVNRWISELKAGNRELLEAFRIKVFGLSLNQKISKRNNLMAALDYVDKSEINDQKEILVDATDLFNKTFGYRSQSFIATTFVWDPEIEYTLFKSGIKYLQGISFQYIPNPGGEWYKRKYHYTGQKNRSGQLYLVRNAFFEPALMPGKDVVGECLHRISLAFNWNKPAIVGSHRVNFIGSVEAKNRGNNLKLFRELLSRIITKWPDVEFMTTDNLGKLLSNDLN